MFARRVVTKLPSAVRAARNIRTSAPLDATEAVAVNEVPFIKFERNEASGATEVHQSALSINQNQPIEMAIPIVDIARQAFPLEKSLVEKLSPTLKKFTLQGKVALITGGARGLGWNMAQALTEVGVKAVAILDVNKELGDKAAEELHASTGIPVQFFQVDVRDAKAATDVVTEVTENFGSVDVLINSAGIADSNIKAEDYDHEMFRRLIDINVTGSFLVAQACGRQMIAQGNGGSIIFIASMSGSIVNYPQEQSCYNASKAAVIQMSKSLAAEWAQYGIRVNSISPGYMDTTLNRVPALEGQKKIWRGRTPQNRLGRVDELDNLAVFLASDASTFMTGSNCVADGGYSIW
ncbi:hypothetical protein MMC12_000619 [Toensbergia leucococca]|nr:hypothetical protein [Toensbergia leucococca]